VLIGEYGFSVTGMTGVAAVPDRKRAYFLERAVAAAEAMPFVSGLCWYGFLPDSANVPRGPSHPRRAARA
jgi:hypothetical protein